MVAETPQDFRDRAAECERLAATATNPEARETMIYVASRWRALAEEDEKRLRSRKPKTEPAAPA
jgi:hypothetical protein